MADPQPQRVIPSADRNRADDERSRALVAVAWAHWHGVAAGRASDADAPIDVDPETVARVRRVVDAIAQAR